MRLLDDIIEDHWTSLDWISQISMDHAGYCWTSVNIIGYRWISLNTVGYDQKALDWIPLLDIMDWSIPPWSMLDAQPSKCQASMGVHWVISPPIVRCVQKFPNEKNMRKRFLRSQLVANDGWQWVSCWLNAMKHNSFHGTIIPIGVYVSLKQAPTRFTCPKLLHCVSRRGAPNPWTSP